VAAGKSKAWQLAEYERLMGSDAAARQSAPIKAKERKVRCNCSQSSTIRAEEIGPYHKYSCPMYAPETV
jgi:hypothetical protein